MNHYPSEETYTSTASLDTFHFYQVYYLRVNYVCITTKEESDGVSVQVRFSIWRFCEAQAKEAAEHQYVQLQLVKTLP